MPSLLIRSPAVPSGDLAVGSLSDAGRVGEETETECREVMKLWLRVSLALLMAGRGERGGKEGKKGKDCPATMLGSMPPSSRWGEWWWWSWEVGV